MSGPESSPFIPPQGMSPAEAARQERLISDPSNIQDAEVVPDKPTNDIENMTGEEALRLDHMEGPEDDNTIGVNTDTTSTESDVEQSYETSQPESGTGGSVEAPEMSREEKLRALVDSFKDDEDGSKLDKFEREVAASPDKFNDLSTELVGEDAKKAIELSPLERRQAVSDMVNGARAEVKRLDKNTKSRETRARKREEAKKEALHESIRENLQKSKDGRIGAQAAREEAAKQKDAREWRYKVRTHNESITAANSVNQEYDDAVRAKMDEIQYGQRIKYGSLAIEQDSDLAQKLASEAEEEAREAINKDFEERGILAGQAGYEGANFDIDEANTVGAERRQAAEVRTSSLGEALKAHNSATLEAANEKERRERNAEILKNVKENQRENQEARWARWFADGSKIYRDEAADKARQSEVTDLPFFSEPIGSDDEHTPPVNGLTESLKDREEAELKRQQEVFASTGSLDGLDKLKPEKKRSFARLRKLGAGALLALTGISAGVGLWNASKTEIVEFDPEKTELTTPDKTSPEETSVTTTNRTINTVTPPKTTTENKGNTSTQAVDLKAYPWENAHNQRPGHELELINQALAQYNNQSGTEYELENKGKNSMIKDKKTGKIMTAGEMAGLNRTIEKITNKS
jgi:hypothetical protein